MSTTVCLAADTIGYPEGGGHFWVCLNWALGFRALGCRVIWLETMPKQWNRQRAAKETARMREWLAPFGFGEALALVCAPPDLTAELHLLTFDETRRADLLFNFHYMLPQDVVAGFRRSALLDIDPGLLQIWLSQQTLQIAEHDHYFTTGANVGMAGAKFPDAGIAWKHVVPCVALDQWPVTSSAFDSRFTTISHWWAHEWMVEGDGSYYRNDKRTGFISLENLAGLTSQPLELALNGAENERDELNAKGWGVVDSHAVSSTPEAYRSYIQLSRGEFGWAKPAYQKLQSGWISDRTPCYLASGKPAVLQETGPLSFLPEEAGIFRYATIQEAAAHLDRVASDYDLYSRLARQTAEEHFCATKMARRVLEAVL